MQRWFSGFLAVVFALIQPALVQAELESLNDREMSSVDARGGLAFQLKDFRILNGSDHTFTYYPSETSDDEIQLENINLIETVGNDETSNSLGHDNEKVTTGTFSDPITLDIMEGSQDPNTTDEYLELRLPSDDNSMEPNTLRVAALNVHDDSYDDYTDYDLGRLEINGADYTGGTKLQFSGKQDGGIRLGLGIKLDGRFQIDSDNGGLALQDVKAANSCTLGDGVTPCGETATYDADGDGYDETIEGPQHDEEWNFDGALTWADLSGDRPLTVDFLGDAYDASERVIALEFNPRRISPSAGQVAFESMWMGGDSYGESYTDELRIVNMRIRGPVSVSSRVGGGSGYSCNGDHSGC